MRRLLLIVVLLFGGGPVAAQSVGYYDLEDWTDAGTSIRPAKPQEWHGVVGVGLGMGPTYLGADSYETKLLPIAEVEYRHTFFLSTRKGAGIYFLRRRQFRIGGRVTVDLGRDSTDDSTLSGLPDIDPGIELGALAEYYTGPFRLRGSLRQEVAGGHGGYLFDAEIAYGGRWSENFSVIVGGNFTVMSDAYADSYFSVAAADATAIRPKFQAGFGIRDAGIFAQGVYDISSDIFLSLEARANYLLFDAANSPLSQNDPQFFGGVGAGIRF